MRFYFLKTSCIIPFFRLRSGLVNFSGLCIFLQCSLPSYPHEFPKKAFNFLTTQLLYVQQCQQNFVQEKNKYMFYVISQYHLLHLFSMSSFIFRLQSLLFLCNFHYQLSYRRPWIHSFEEKIHFKAILTQYFIYLYYQNETAQ